MKVVIMFVLVPFLLLSCAAPATPTTPPQSTTTSAGVGASATTAQQPTAVPQPTATVQPPATPAPKPTDTPKPQLSPTPGLAKVGQRVETKGIAFTVNKVTKADQIGDFQKAKAGSTYVIVDVTIENVSADKAPYNLFYFRVKDADSFEYSATINVSNDALKSGELAKGEKVRGTVATEVPAAAKGLVLSYAPLVVVGGYTIRVDLGL